MWFKHAHRHVVCIYPAPSPKIGLGEPDPPAPKGPGRRTNTAVSTQSRIRRPQQATATGRRDQYQQITDYRAAPRQTNSFVDLSLAMSSTTRTVLTAIWAALHASQYGIAITSLNGISDAVTCTSSPNGNIGIHAVSQQHLLKSCIPMQVRVQWMNLELSLTGNSIRSRRFDIHARRSHRQSVLGFDHTTVRTYRQFQDLGTAPHVWIGFRWSGKLCCRHDVRKVSCTSESQADVIKGC